MSATCRDEVTVSELGLLRFAGASQVRTDVKRQTAGNKRGDATNLYLPAHVWEVSCSSGAGLELSYAVSRLDGCHGEVLYLQPLIPSKRLDVFPPLTGGCSEGLGAF